MTQGKVITTLALEMVKWTGHPEFEDYFRQCLAMALSIGIEHYTPHMTEIDVFDTTGKYINSYKSADDAATKLGINRGNIYQCLRGTRHSHHGYMFRRTQPVMRKWIRTRK